MYKMQEEKTMLGLFRVHTLEWYDGPLLKWAENEDGENYIAVLWDRGFAFDAFLYIPVSKEKCQSFLEGLLSLKTIMEENEKGSFFLVNHHYENFEIVVEKSNIQKLTFQEVSGHIPDNHHCTKYEIGND